jgi:predicted nucleotidyltransferase
MVDQHPTRYQDVNEILNLLLAEARAILSNHFVGMYLYGSLSSGDFDPDGSDIDFLVVTTGVLPQETVAELKTMHYHLWNTGLKWADKLEGSYIPKAHLRRFEKTDIAYPTVNEGQFYTAPHGSDWIIQRHIIHEQGIVLAGPDPKTLIDPIGPGDIRCAVTGILQEWWFPMLENPSWLKNHGSEYHAYAILTMCRSLYAVEYGKIISKPAAARWAQKELGGKWLRVIEQALAVRIHQGDFDLYNESLELIRFTMEQIGFTGRRR